VGDDCGGTVPDTSESGGFGNEFLVDDLEPPEGGGSSETCVDLDVNFDRVTPTVVMLIDQSGSMAQPFENGVNRWDTLGNTLTNSSTSLVKKLETSVRFGMALFTGDSATCPRMQTVDIGLGTFSSISSTLRRNGPSGDTPTAESLEAITAQLVAFGEDGPKSIILATDGEPDTCEFPDANDEDFPKDLSVAAVEAAFAQNITTRVISVGNDVGADHLKDLAVAGAGGDQTAEAFTALDTAALENAFNEIIGSVRTCDFTLEGTVAANDAARGTVLLDGNPIVFGNPNGWEMPDEQTVRLLGSACEQVQDDVAGVSMRFPCDAIQIIPR
jgi:hypothetical protein